MTNITHSLNLSKGTTKQSGREKTLTLDCFAPLAMTKGSPAMTRQSCHCETRSGEAIQTKKAFTLDCFAPLAMTKGSPAMTRQSCHCETRAAKQSRRRRRSPWIASLAMTKGLLAMTGDLPAMTGGESSLRDAKRRSNPDGAPLWGEWKMENVVFWKRRVPFLSFSIIHLPFSIRAKRALFVGFAVKTLWKR
ncbi:MAG: hypothetical protein LBT00_06515 [Spirochaetaceae bacterium]|nr:hypothetical protein [Spirochaetaceae bacterium]